jgi:hypothetical protein
MHGMRALRTHNLPNKPRGFPSGAGNCRDSSILLQENYSAGNRYRCLALAIPLGLFARACPLCRGTYEVAFVFENPSAFSAIKLKRHQSFEEEIQ